MLVGLKSDNQNVTKTSLFGHNGVTLVSLASHFLNLHKFGPSTLHCHGFPFCGQRSDEGVQAPLAGTHGIAPRLIFMADSRRSVLCLVPGDPTPFRHPFWARSGPVPTPLAFPELFLNGSRTVTNCQPGVC